jgi:hypothetical protein
MVHVCSFMMLGHSRSWKLTMGIRRKSQVLLIFSHAFFLLPLCSEIWNLQHQCSYTNADLQWKRPNWEKTITACFMYIDVLSCALCLPLSTGLGPTSWGAVCQWKLWWQHDSLAGWVMETPPSSHLSEASCCLIWRRHRYGHLWFRALVLFLQWGHQAVRKLGFH